MPDPRRVDPPPLHQLDGHHAVTLKAISHWVSDVYPSVVTEHADRTQQWDATAMRLYQTMAPMPDRDKALAYLSQVCAELLLAHAEHLTGQDTDR